MLSCITQGSLSLFPAISSAMLWQSRAEQLSPWSHVLLLASATAVSSEIFLSKKILLPFAGLLGRCHLFLPGVPRGGYNFVSAGLLVGRPLVLAACASSTGLHRAAGKWQPVTPPQILLSFLFLLAYLFIQPLSLSDWYQSSQCRYSCFHHSILKNVKHW